MKRKGFTLLEILVVVSIVAMLTIIALPDLLKARIIVDDVIAQATLKTIGTSMENYLTDHETYPLASDDLITPTPSYLNKNFFTGTHFGYTFSGTFGADEYTIVATPVIIGQTGTTTYAITTGAVLLTGS